MQIENRKKVREIDEKIERIDEVLKCGIRLFFLNSGYLRVKKLFEEVAYLLSNERFNKVVNFIKSNMEEEKEELIKELEKL